MKREFRRRFWLETALALVTGLLAIVTLISREWIEIVFGVDPDGGSGAVEWMIVAVLACVTVAASIVARTEFLRTPAPTS